MASARALLGCMVGAAVLLASSASEAQQPGQPPAAGEAEAPSGDPEITPPKLIKDVKPTYPESAKAEGVAAEVVLTIDIDATGVVQNAMVAVASDAKEYGFEQAALDAARKLVFEPARLGDKPIPVRITYRFRFVPDVKPPPGETAEPKPPEPDRPKPPPKAAPPSGELSGTLMERGTRLPMAGVTVTVFRGEGADAEGYETDTDEQGNFRFKGLGVGPWRLLADPAGYYPLRTTEQVAADTRTTVEFTVERRSYNPYDVVVEGERVKREVNRTTIDARQAERVPGTFGDVLGVVKNFPGVARGGFGQVIIRGAAPEDSRFFVNGVDVPQMYHFIGIRSVLPVGMIEQLDFYPGNYSVEFGRATGGVIDVQTRKLAPKKIGGYADLSILDGSLYLEAPITDELAVAAGIRRSWIDFVIEQALTGMSSSLVVPRYYDYQALASYRPGPAHHVQTFFFASDDRFEIVLDEPADEDPELVVSDVGFTTNFYRAVTEYRYVPSSTFDNELKVAVGRDRLQFNIGQDFYWDLTSLSVQARDTARWQISESFALRAGLDLLATQVDARVRIPELTFEGQAAEVDQDPEDFRVGEVNEWNPSTAVFAELEFRPFERTFILPGVRLDHFGKTDSLVVSPRVTARQGLDEHWTVKGGVGLFAQEPKFEELTEEYGNPDLDPEKAIHYSVGVEYQPLDHLVFDVTGFYKTLFDQVSPTDAVTQRNGETVPLRVNNEGKGRVMGMEVSIRHELANNFFGWVAYTLSRAERLDADSDEYRLFDYDQTHILTVIGSYRLPRNWEVGTRWRYVTGNLYTPITGRVWDYDQGNYVGITGPVNSARVGAFHQLDVRIDKRWIYESWILGAYLDIQNAYSRSNPEGLGYNFDKSEEKTERGLPILPVIGLRGEF